MSSGQSRCTSRSAQEPCWYVPTAGQTVILVIADAVSRWALTLAAYPTQVGGGIREPEEP